MIENLSMCLHETHGDEYSTLKNSQRNRPTCHNINNTSRIEPMTVYTVYTEGTRKTTKKKTNEKSVRRGGEK